MSFSKGQKCTVDLGDLFAKCATKQEVCLRCKLRKLSLLSKHRSVQAHDFYTIRVLKMSWKFIMVCITVRKI